MLTLIELIGVAFLKYEAGKVAAALWEKWQSSRKQIAPKLTAQVVETAIKANSPDAGRLFEVQRSQQPVRFE